MSKRIILISAIVLVIAAVVCVGINHLNFTEKLSFSDKSDDIDRDRDSKDESNDVDKDHASEDKSDHIEKRRALEDGYVIIYEAAIDNPTDEQMDTALSLMRTRLDGLGYHEATVKKQGKKRIKVEIPSVSDPEETAKILGATARLQFVDYEGNVVLTDSDIKDAIAEYDSINEMGSNEHYILLKLKPEGVQKFADATERVSALPYGQNYIAIMMDEIPISIPSVNERIESKECIISSTDFTAESAKNLAAQIRSGQLPFTLNPIEIKAKTKTQKNQK